MLTTEDRERLIDNLRWRAWHQRSLSAEQRKEALRLADNLEKVNRSFMRKAR